MKHLTHPEHPGFDLYIGQELPRTHIFAPYVEDASQALLAWCEEDSPCDIVFHTEEDKVEVRWIRYDQANVLERFVICALDFLQEIGQQAHYEALLKWYQN